MENVSFGIWVQGYAADGSTNQTITLKYNLGMNMLGRVSDGAGGYISGQHIASHFIQISNVYGISGAEIAWNQAIDEPYNSSVDDVINIYDANATSQSHLLIHDNYIQGAYPDDPTVDSYSGGGIITDGYHDTLQDATAYVDVYNNQVVSTTNYGIAFATGHDNLAYGNYILSSGLLPNGQRIAGQNVGMYVSDIYGVNVANGTMFNDHFTGNTVGWANYNDPSNGNQNGAYFSIPGTSNDYANNTFLPTVPTLADEQSQYQNWVSKTAAAGVTVGPMGTSTPSGARPSSGVTYRLMRQQNVAGSRLCLDDANGKPTPGTNVQVASCNTLPPQNWLLQGVGYGYFQLVNQQNDLCLDDTGAQDSADANVQMEKCINDQTQY